MQPFDSFSIPSRPTHRALSAALGVATLAGVFLAWTALAGPTFVPNDQPNGWVTRPTLSSFNLVSNQETIYRAGFMHGAWTGRLTAFEIDASGAQGGASRWSQDDAATLLDLKVAGTGYDLSRVVFTHDGSTGVAFRTAKLSATALTHLGSTTTEQTNTLNFIRGDRSQEGATGGLRARTTVLGDIIHSPLTQWNHGNGIKRLYVGANDGKMHVFDAATGQELYAYVPATVIPRLKNLTSPSYSHTHYVDGPFTVSEVGVTTASPTGGPATTATKTYLVGGLGAGGMGLYALDVTASSTAVTEADAASRVKWEVSNASTGFANLGFTYSIPRLARLNDGNVAVVVGNGYQNTGTQKASLFFINAETGALIRELPVTSADEGAAPNGLSSPTLLDTNGDGKVDRAYAGDLNGNLWKFDLSGSTPSGFTVSKLFTTNPVASITTAPSVQRHPKGGYMVTFGTGRMLQAADASTTDAHYIYGIWDGAPAANTVLLAQTIAEVNHTVGGVVRTLRYASTNQPNWGDVATGDKHKGWRLALPTAGERVVGDSPFINEGRFYFTSSNPNTAALTTGGSTGAGWFNQINTLTGGGFADPLLDINSDGVVTTADNVGGQVILGAQLNHRGIYSQPILSDLRSLSLTLFNTNPNLAGVAENATVDGGVAGGHFDVDIYYPKDGAFESRKHVHEYDDKFDAVGVNMLNATEPLFNLSNAISTSDKQFKILVLNQYLNPASVLKVGANAAFRPVSTFQGQASAATAVAALSSAPTYTRADIANLEWRVPFNAFETANWWNASAGLTDGDERAGLIPTKTGCVKDNPKGHGTPGKFGERHNGALTIQIIKADTPSSALELNHKNGDLKYGWRVKQGADFKATEFKTYVLAEYTYFWHADTDCYHESGWNPAPTAKGATDASQATGTGSFNSLLGLVGTAPGTVDGSNPGDGGNIDRGITETQQTTGRVNWREVIRE